MRNLKWLVYFLRVSIALLPIIIHAQTSKANLESKIDSLFSDIGNKQVPGSAVLVVKDGEVLLNRGYGLASLEYRIPIRPTTVFDIASVSKQFVGFAISTLIEQGKISLTDDIRKYIPELHDFGHLITIEHLVHHTSGIRDWTGTLAMGGWGKDDTIKFDQILRMAYNQRELNFIPGEEFKYSNTGYNLLVEVVQRVTGVSFREWTHNNIFQPLGMNNSFFLDDLTEIIPNKANSYYKDENGIYHTNINNTSAPGSSSLNTTTEDLAKWIINLDNKKIGGKSVIERMYQTINLNNGEPNTYSYGFWVGEFRGAFWVDHTGGWESYRTYLTHFPDKHLSVVILNNNDQGAFNHAMEIVGLFIPETDAKEPAKKNKVSKNKRVKIKSEILEEYVGTYKFGPAWYVHITRKDANLYAQETGEENQPLTPNSKTSFEGQDFGNSLDFTRNENDEISGINYNGKIRRRVNGRKNLDMATLSEFEGEYYSDELKTSYMVMKDENGISLNHFRQGRSKLLYAFNDDFIPEKEWWTQSIEFVRDKSENIVGFKATEGGARNQMFNKTN